MAARRVHIPHRAAGRRAALPASVERQDPGERAVSELEKCREEFRAERAALTEAQRLLEESRDRYADLFEFAPIAYALLDENGVVQDINLTGATLIGLERAHLIGYPFHAFLTDRRAFVDYMTRCRQTPGAVETEVMLRPRQGGPIAVHLTTKRFAPVEDRVIFHMGIVDVTQRKRIENEQLRLAREHDRARAASEAKDRFLAVLSHELRTPLTPILFTLGALRQAGVVPEVLAPALAMIQRSVELEARLIDDLLDVTRITRGKLHLELETVDAHAAMEEVVELCAEEVRAAKLRVAFDLGAATHHVRADATRLRQVLWNLLKNAIHSTPPGGRITLRSENLTDRVLLSVTDTGRGILPTMLEKLFGPFEQGYDGAERSAGLGLGLAIAKGIVEAHGGRISAASPGADKGATFTVELATTSATAAQALPRRPAGQTSRRPAKVLLVEDNRDNAAAISELLRVHGYEVDVASSVKAGLEQAEKGFDVLVSDIGLPDGTGRDLIRKLCAKRAVRGIALTGYGTDEDVRSNADAGFTRHLTKPVDPDELLAAVGDLAAIAGDERRSERSSRSRGG